MMHLLHYEFRRTRLVKWVILGLAAAIEAVFLIAVQTRSRSATVISSLLIIVLALGGTMATGLAGILLLHRDLTSEEGYMVFLTPKRCWSILGAKMLECLFSLSLCAFFFYWMVRLDVDYLFAHEGKLSSYWRLGTEFLNNPSYFLQEFFDISADFPIQVDLRHGSMVTAAFVCYVASWEGYMAAATFAVVLAESVMPGRKRGVIAAFAIFSVIGYGLHWSQTRLPVLDPYWHSLYLASAVSLGVSAVLYAASAPLLQRRFSV